MSRYRQVSISLGPRLTGVVKKLIIATSGFFLLTYLPWRLFHWSSPYEWFSLQPYDVLHHFYVWQLVTYLFLHADPFHLVFNMLALWMFGSDLERQWGSRRFLFYYFLTGAGAGLCDVVLTPLLSPHTPTATIGCSGAVYGLLLAFGLLFPDRPVLYALILPIKAKWFALLAGMLEFLYSLGTPGSGVSHVAHLGGMLFGFIYLRGGGLSYRWQLLYHEWRRGRLRKQFEIYMRKREGKNDADRWVN